MEFGIYSSGSFAGLRVQILETLLQDEEVLQYYILQNLTSEDYSQSSVCLL